MNDAFRSAVFVGVAAVSLLTAWITSTPTTRTAKNELGETGKIFYPEFQDPTVPDSIKVTMVDEGKAIEKNFEVQVKDGQWSIPSHHGYPADGKDRLAKTAASVINLKREELRSRAVADHEKLGVLDPAKATKSALKGYGRRITLSEKGSAVMDLIIGNELEKRPGFYFVRKPEEAATYVAKVNVDLSTKFSDWIEPDLLKIDRDQLTAVKVDNYSIDEERGVRIPGDVNILTRDKSSDPWILKGIDTDKEELEASRVAGIVNTLDDLKLIGVRPKPAQLRDYLQGKSEGIGRDDALSLQSRGFYVTQRGQLLANEGEMSVVTNKGIVYDLQFGEIFTGDDLELETGLTPKDKKPDEKKPDAGAAPAATGKSGRYLFVRAGFDEDQMPGKPVKPVKPKVPAAEPAADAPKEEKADAPKVEAPKGDAPKEAPKEDAPKADAPKEAAPKEEPKPEAKPDDAPKKEEEPKPEAKAEEAKPADAKPEAGCEDPKPEAAPEAPKAEEAPKAAEAPKAEEAPKAADAPKAAEAPKATEPPKAADAPKAAEAPAATTPPAAAKPPVKTAEDLEKEYQAALKQYETDLAAWKTKVTEATKEAETLNDRFAEWYYVISADDFEKLHVARKDLVKAKAPAAAPAGAAVPGAPGTLPAATEPPPAVKPEAAKPAVKTDAEKADADKPEPPKAEAPKPEAPKDEKPTAPAKAEAEAKPADAKPEAPKEAAPKTDEKPEAAAAEEKPQAEAPKEAPKPE